MVLVEKGGCGMTMLVYTLTIFALLLCVGSVVAALLNRAGDSRRAFDAAWVVAVLLFVADWVLAQAPPFGNMRHVLAFFPLVMVPAAHYLRRFRGLELTSWLAAASALALVGALCMPLQATWRQMPALQSPWFAPHVIAYVVSYGLMTVAALLTLASFRREEKLAEAGEVVRLSLPFMTFGHTQGPYLGERGFGIRKPWFKSVPSSHRPSLLGKSLIIRFFFFCKMESCQTSQGYCMRKRERIYRKACF